MPKLSFTRATKTQSRLRMALDGPSGSGKTFTALIGAFVLVGENGRVALIDTERGSASKYADRFPPFDTLELESFSPQTYTEAIKVAGEEGYDVLIVDSLSHAWEGEGGALDLVDRMASKGGGNSYTAWKDVTPMHRRMVDALLQSPCHIIATMRSKMEYVLEPDAKGKMVPRKVGMAPIQRQGMEYEFDIVVDLDINHKLIVSKTRCPAVDGAEEIKPGARWFVPIRGWLTDGAPAPAFLEDPAKAAGVRTYLTKGGLPDATQEELIELWRKERLTREQLIQRADAAIARAKATAEPVPKAPASEAKSPEPHAPVEKPDPKAEIAQAAARYQDKHDPQQQAPAPAGYLDDLEAFDRVKLHIMAAKVAAGPRDRLLARWKEAKLTREQIDEAAKVILKHFKWWKPETYASLCKSLEQDGVGAVEACALLDVDDLRFYSADAQVVAQAIKDAAANRAEHEAADSTPF